jgi:hypothetical protein
VQVGAAQRCAADTDDDLVRPGDLRLGDVVDVQVVLVV